MAAARVQNDSRSISFFLCFGGLRFSSGSTCDGGGVPTFRRARRLASLVARKGFGRRNFRMVASRWNKQPHNGQPVAGLHQA